MQVDLFGSLHECRDGFRYQPEFITEDEERALLEAVRDLPLEEAQYKQYTARRRTVSYGSRYDFGRGGLDLAPSVPDFLLPLRERVGQWMGLPAEQFVHALVTEYRPGTPLGWHRDVPEFEAIAGVSLLGSSRMRLRPFRPGERHRKQDVIVLELEPRSAYQIRGEARWAWQHSIAPTRELRYSITFRTVRGRR
jgi:alkylated DNA repair dioxygenase AlkB